MQINVWEIVPVFLYCVFVSFPLFDLFMLGEIVIRCYCLIVFLCLFGEIVP